ncbi:hypothetical protein K469DRAFT_62549 [Zopfia rhizophila CBS 207.26]|uniref:Uncharacterized protein n=1 Tax=Zopfia rhizophila CBS 207.26 TaxID=1314779 RepID=A0A6A6EF80_9PEZI|nr:hypothetical protein K469DRAFT_62549 [Zopfia rhizophila CBS 207.26]
MTCNSHHASGGLYPIPRPALSSRCIDGAEKEQKAVRVLLIVSQNSPYWSQSWLSTEDVFPVALKAIRQAGLIGKGETELPLRLLVKQKWPLRVLIVFDISNNSYNAELGHLPEHNNLPVLVIHFSTKGVLS